MIKFDDLKPGFQNLFVQLDHVQEAFGTSWTGFSIQEIVYVNKSDKEVVYRSGSLLYSMTAEQFDRKGYRKPERL